MVGAVAADLVTGVVSFPVQRNTGTTAASVIAAAMANQGRCVRRESGSRRGNRRAIEVQVSADGASKGKAAKASSQPRGVSQEVRESGMDGFLYLQHGA